MVTLQEEGFGFRVYGLGFLRVSGSKFGQGPQHHQGHITATLKSVALEFKGSGFPCLGLQSASALTVPLPPSVHYIECDPCGSVV